MKVKRLIRKMDKSATMKLAQGKEFNVPAHIMLEKNPQACQYLVEYENGHISFHE